MLNAEFTVKTKGAVLVPQKRKERSDKVKDIKFPVTPEQRAELRRRSQNAKDITESNTRILLAALQKYRQDPHAFPRIRYVDTGVYMHAKPTGLYYEQIEDLFITLDEDSRRSMVYRLVMNYIGKGEQV